MFKKPVPINDVRTTSQIEPVSLPPSVPSGIASEIKNKVASNTAKPTATEPVLNTSVPSTNPSQPSTTTGTIAEVSDYINSKNANMNNAKAELSTIEHYVKLDWMYIILIVIVIIVLLLLFL